jgi:protein arginine kinase
VSGGNGMGVPSPTVDDRGTSWLDGSGQDHEIVLSTRVRLARNLQGYTFALRADADDRRSVLDQVRHALGASADLDDGVLWEMSELEAVERRILHERHVVSRELIGPDEGPAPDGTALALGASGPCGVMINEEDHLRIQSLHNGMELEAAWKQVSELDEALGSRLPYAFHHEFGFLTCCPTNVGTGLRASVLVHLPGLVLTKEIARVRRWSETSSRSRIKQRSGRARRISWITCARSAFRSSSTRSGRAPSCFARLPTFWKTKYGERTGFCGTREASPSTR